MKTILITLLLLFTCSTKAHEGPADDHAYIIAFDEKNNIMHLFKGTDHYNLDQYTILFDAGRNITKIYKGGKVIDKTTAGIHIVIDRDHGRIFVYGDHGEFVPLQ